MRGGSHRKVEAGKGTPLFEVGPPASDGVRHSTQCGGGASGEQPSRQADFPLGDARQRIYLKDRFGCLSSIATFDFWAPFDAPQIGVPVFPVIEFASRKLRVDPIFQRVLHGKERRWSHDVPGCLPALSAHQKEIPQSLHALGDRDFHPHGGHRRLFAMVSSVYGAPFAVPSRSRQESGKRGEIKGRQVDTHIAAEAILLRMLATLRDRSISKDATCVITYFCAE